MKRSSVVSAKIRGANINSIPPTGYYRVPASSGEYSGSTIRMCAGPAVELGLSGPALMISRAASPVRTTAASVASNYLKAPGRNRPFPADSPAMHNGLSEVPSRPDEREHSHPAPRGKQHS